MARDFSPAPGTFASKLNVAVGCTMAAGVGTGINVTVKAQVPLTKTLEVISEQ